MASDARGLLRFALLTHEGGYPEIAAEIFHRILTAYPFTAESRVAVHYLNSGREPPPDAWSVALDSTDQTLPPCS